MKYNQLIHIPLVAVLFMLTLMPTTGRCEDIKGRMKQLADVGGKVSIAADNISYDRKTGVYHAVGKVKITRGAVELSAAEVSYNEVSGDAEATGGAVLVTAGNVLLSDTIRVNFNTEQGVIQKGSIFVKEQNYHLKGDSLQKVSESEYKIFTGDITTCDAPVPFWRVSSKELDVRMDKDIRARSIVFRIKDVPVMYMPYAWFPLLKPRTSGFLIPGAGYSTKEGVRLFTSYYWAPVDNFDTTLSVDYRSKRGVGFANETRFALNKDTQTTFNGYYMKDIKEDKTRYNLLLTHQQVFTPSMSGKLLLNLSDREYFRDLTDSARERTQRSVDSNLFITNRWDWGRGYMVGQYTRGLDVINNDLIVQRAPEVGANVLKKQIFGLPVYLDFDASAAYFYKQTGVSGFRMDLFPKLSAIYRLGGINISPRIGYMETIYSLHGIDRDIFDEERGLFGTGIKAETGFFKYYTFAGGLFTSIRHTIEPAVAYDFVSERGGSAFPKFDDVDVYSRRNQFAYSLSNRFVIKYRSRPDKPDFFTIKFSQFCDLYRERMLGHDRSLSNLYGEMVYLAAKPLITINSDYRYDVYTGSLMSVNTDIKFEQEAKDWYFIVGQRYSKDAEQVFMSPSRFDFFTPNTGYLSDFKISSRVQEEDRVNFLTFEAGGKLTSYLSASCKFWYDIHMNSLRETDVSMIYTSQCWGIKASFIDRPHEQQIIFLLSLKGLGNIRL